MSFLKVKWMSLKDKGKENENSNYKTWSNNGKHYK